MSKFAHKVGMVIVASVAGYVAVRTGNYAFNFNVPISLGECIYKGLAAWFCVYASAYALVELSDLAKVCIADTKSFFERLFSKPSIPSFSSRLPKGNAPAKLPHSVVFAPLSAELSKKVNRLCEAQNRSAVIPNVSSGRVRSKSF